MTVTPANLVGVFYFTIFMQIRAMKKIIILNLFFTFLILSCDNNNKGNEYLLEELNQQVQIKYDQLEDHFRYNVLAYVGDLPKVEEIKESCNKLKENEDFEVVKAEQMDLVTSISAYLIIPTKESDLKLLVTLNELLFLNKLRDLVESNISFNELEPVIFKKKENSKEVQYLLVLAAYDSLFSPSIRFYQEKDTFNVYVNDQGFGEFTVLKNFPAEQHSFQGEVSFFNSRNEEIKLPVTYNK